MGELDEKLNAILGNQEAMGQIMALAQSLGASGALGGGEGRQTAPSQPEPAAPPPAGEGAAFPLGDLDPRIMQMGMRILQEYRREDDQKTVLLRALRPLVREERYALLDRAIQVARLTRVIRAVFQAMGKEGEDRV